MDIKFVLADEELAVLGYEEDLREFSEDVALSVLIDAVNTRQTLSDRMEMNRGNTSFAESVFNQANRQFAVADNLVLQLRHHLTPPGQKSK